MNAGREVFLPPNIIMGGGFLHDKSANAGFRLAGIRPHPTRGPAVMGSHYSEYEWRLNTMLSSQDRQQT